MVRVHKAVDRKRKERQIKKKKASAIRRRLAAVDENEVVAMAEPKEQNMASTDAEMNLL